MQKMMQVEKIKKGLIISANPLNHKNGNGKTFAAMLSKYEANELAQVYYVPGEVDFSICGAFYQITDKEIIKNFLSVKKREIGGEVSAQEETISFVGKADSKVSFTGVRNWFFHTSIVVLLRNFLWRKGKWNNAKFEQWLDKLNVKFVIIGAGNFEFTYKLAEMVCERYGVPLYVSVGDDYFTDDGSRNIFKQAVRKKSEQLLHNAIMKSKGVIAISDAMARRFSTLYGGNYYVCMNCININGSYKKVEKICRSKDIIKLIYVGNVTLKRLPVLQEIGRVIERIATTNAMNIELRVYTNLPLKDRERVSREPYFIVCPPVYGRELERIKNDADIFVHVESFRKDMAHFLETCISTKVPEYLIAQHPILAVGPDYAASVAYFKNTKSAVVVNNINDIENAIMSMIDVDLSSMLDRAYETAVNNFNIDIHAKNIHEMIESSCK